MLLTLQFADLSDRPAEALDEALRGSLYPANLATLAIANIFGTHESYCGPGTATLGDVDLTDNSFNYLFVGSVPDRQRKSGIHSADDAAIIGSFDPAYIRRPVRFDPLPLLITQPK